MAPSFLPWTRSRDAAVWRDPARKLRTLESFAETEADGGHDLEVAARRTENDELRAHLLRHAADERRHAELFREAAERHRAKVGLSAHDQGESDRNTHLAAGRGDGLDAHGFFQAGLIDELGEVSYIAMVHVAEQRAAATFEHHRALVGDDVDLACIFDSILKDEKYHCAYTERFLEQWRKQGRGKEVDEALSSARRSRALGAWRRLGLRSGAHFSRALLFVLYWTLLLPFGLVARSRRDGNVALEGPEGGAVDLRSQY